MHFYKKNKDEPSCLLLNKEEWDRLNRYTDPPEVNSDDHKEHINSLIELSQSWIKTWPDTDAGRVQNYEKEHERRQDMHKAAVDDYIKMKNIEKEKLNQDAVQEARQRIFHETCHGNKLLGALLHSKVIEEREEQIKFKNKLKELKEIESRQPLSYCLFDMDTHDTKEEENKKNTILTAEENKKMFEIKKAQAAMAKEVQKHTDLENMQLMNKLLDLEKEAEKKLILLERQSMKQHLSECKKLKEERAKEDAEYSAKVEMCRKEKEFINCKIKATIKEMNTKSAPAAMKAYDKLRQEKIKQLETAEKNNIKLGELRAAKAERKSKEKKKKDIEKLHSIVKTNKVLAEYESIRRVGTNKCFGDRQTIMLNSHTKRKPKAVEIRDTSFLEKRSSFGPNNKLQTELKKRMKQPSSWTGTKAQHEQFARHADEVLRDSKHKGPAKRVIDQYKKEHGLDNIELKHN